MMGSMMAGMTAGMLLWALLGLALLAMVIFGVAWAVRQVIPGHPGRQRLAATSHGDAAATLTADQASPDTLRAADTDREHTTELLRAHHTVGRLTLEELDQRVADTYRARTLGQLRATLADLPEQQ